MAAIDKRLLKILACPLTKAPVVLDGDRLISTDAATRRVYAVEDGIPNMLVEESSTISPEEHEQILQKHGVSPWQETPAQKKVRS